MSLNRTGTLLRRTWIDYSVEVAASADELYALLSDLDAWPQWTPGLLGLRRREAPLAVGARFSMLLSAPVIGRLALPCQLYVLEPTRIEWGGDLLGERLGSSIRHRFELQALSPTRTRLRQIECASGLFALLLRPFEHLAHRHDRSWSDAIVQRFAQP